MPDMTQTAEPADSPAPADTRREQLLRELCGNAIGLAAVELVLVGVVVLEFRRPGTFEPLGDDFVGLTLLSVFASAALSVPMLAWPFVRRRAAAAAAPRL